MPELLPARMINEYAYCPRLFYLEWVQSQFVDNLETVQGREVHRRVDIESGDIGEDDHRPRVARSVLLSSNRLGLIAKIDLVESSGGEVSPVDYKRGTAPNIPERAFEPERVQLCVQGMILRESGYRCSRGVLYFAGSRERVEVEFDESLCKRTTELAAEARDIAARQWAPPPLLDSPKCPRCSLVGICLPDEINHQSGRFDGPPRRLIPSDPSAAPLYVTEQGAYVGVRSGRVEVRKKKELLASRRVIDVSQICIFGNAQLSTQALRSLFARQIPVLYFSYGGWFAGIAHGHPSKHVALRMRQLAEAGRQQIPLPREFVRGKVANARTLLRRNARRAVDRALGDLKRAQTRLDSVDSQQELLGVEGLAARIYFGAFAAMLQEDSAFATSFDEGGRSRRPPRDPVNCLLSFCYGLLVKDLTAATLGVGFDPYVGLYHRPRFGRPALALDLAEEFRPLVADSVVVNVINNGEVGPADFVSRAGGVQLTAAGRKSVIRAYERRLAMELTHPVFEYRITMRRALELQARFLGACLLGEVPNYVALTTR